MVIAQLSTDKVPPVGKPVNFQTFLRYEVETNASENPEGQLETAAATIVVADPEERSTVEDTKGKVAPTAIGVAGIATTGAGGGGGDGGGTP